MRTTTSLKNQEPVPVRLTVADGVVANASHPYAGLLWLEFLARPEAQALMRSVIDQFDNYAKLNKRLPAETSMQLGEIENPSILADAVASNLSIKVADKQAPASAVA